MIFPQQLRKIGNKELKIVWSDGHESIYPFFYLRQECHCALCVEEGTSKGILKRDSVPKDLEGLKVSLVGQYAIRIDFGDGHTTGIYPFSRLREICLCCRQDKK
jgi:DUF971 family protein